MRYDFNKKEFVDKDIDSNKLAIVGSDHETDWDSLQVTTERLTCILKDLNISKGCPIIIYGHKEALFPAAILSCIHSTTTYIPIDKIYPVERIKKIIEITGVQVIIQCSENIPIIDIPVLIKHNLEIVTTGEIDNKTTDYNSEKEVPQYIMFTSGSTGEPKGVQITNSCILNFVNWASRAFNLSKGDVFMNQAPFTFDVSLCDIINSFRLGSTLVLSSTDMIKDQDSFLERLNHYKCSVWTSTPSFVYIFLRNQKFNTHNIPSLKSFIFMGEDLPNRTCSKIRDIFNESKIFNAYGPTEATIVTTLVEIDDDIIKNYPLLPIGYPKDDSILLIDKQNPNDKEGELIIVGDNVCTGYFKDEELSKEKFFIHNGQRAYKTGDLAYYENDMLFCIGRNDDQIKMHGFRIELNEISMVICENSLVSEAITIALKRNNEVKKIISFVILEDDISKEDLVSILIPFLEKKLPYYMIPGDIDIVKEFPYNISHKIDKNTLISDYLNRKLQ
ncbi:MAG: AMP-binding protein [Bacteroidales bacterium]